MTRPLIALDGDNVLLDYRMAYASAWARAFGYRPIERDPTAYWPIDQWGVERLAGDRLDSFRRVFDEEFWSTIPAVGGALEACHRLTSAGFDLICVSAIEPVFERARLRNLRELGFRIERVVATTSARNEGNPKAQAIEVLAPVAFVDDYLPYLCGITDSVHTELILGQPTGSPNSGPQLNQVKSKHLDLAAFAQWWVEKLEE